MQHVCVQDALKAKHAELSSAAFERLHRESFGEVEGLLDDKLRKALDKEFRDVVNRNEVQSTRLCEQLENQVRCLCLTLEGAHAQFAWFVWDSVVKD